MLRSVFLHTVTSDFTPALLIVGAVMFGAWTLAYAQIVITCFRDKTYGLPLASIFLNIAWEFTFSFSLIAPEEAALVWGNRLWFLVDCVLVLQVFLYGRRTQTIPWVRDNFYAICITSILLSGLGIYFFATYFQDIYGLATSFLMNLAMSVLFIPLLFSRPDLKGLPYGAAWTKMLGTLSGAVFCYIWWPMQFDTAGILVRPPYIHQPPNSHLLYFLYVTIPLIDFLYIYLYWQRRKTLAAYQPTVT